MRVRFTQLLVNTLRACGWTGAAQALEDHELARIADGAVRRMQRRFRREGYRC